MFSDHDYDPLCGSMTYQVFNMIGTYDPVTMRITPTSNTPNGNVVISLNDHSYPASYQTKDMVARFYHAVGTPSSPPNLSASVQDAKWILPNNQEYIGELVNELGYTIIPPEPKLAKHLVAGQVIEQKSIVRNSATDNTIINPSFHWKYRTIEHFPVAWGNFVDCWRTGLIEYGVAPTKDRVYNYLFMRDKGLVNFWYGDLVGNQVTGHQFYAQI